jgi:hypothetical protein
MNYTFAPVFEDLHRRAEGANQLPAAAAQGLAQSLIDNKGRKG